MQHALDRDLDHVIANTSEVWNALRGEHIFITGGTGFIGTWLVESFAWANDHLDLNAKAVVLSRNPQAYHSKSPYAANHPSIQLIEGSLDDFKFPYNECRIVIHAVTDQTAATPEEPAGTFDREVRGTRRLLDFVRAHTTKRLLFTSSGAVYGRQPSELIHVPEEYPGAPEPLEMRSAYGEAKRVSEFLLSAHARQFGFDAIITRLFAFAGAYLPLNINFAVGNFVRDVLSGGPVKIEGDGTPHRSYLYAADMAIWLWQMLLRGESLRPYNVGSPQSISILELANTIVETLSPGMPITIAGTPKPGAPVARYVPCVKRAEQELGLHSLIPLPEQIRRMYEWHRARREAGFSSP